MPPPRSTLLFFLLLASPLRADPPLAGYVFPAGGQRGTTVKVRVGGVNLHDRCGWELTGPGVTFARQISRMPGPWFEGPLLPLPDSQRTEDYPRDMAGEVRIAADARTGTRRVRLWTAEGASSGPSFVVGELPEVLEQEIDGDPVPVAVKLPVTINGRIFPRENVDVWTFSARKGQPITCAVDAARLGSPLDSRLEVRGPAGDLVAENDDHRGPDSLVSFVAPADGTYRVRIMDTTRGGSPRHVYRLTIHAAPFIRAIFPLGGKAGERVRLRLGGTGVSDEEVTILLPAGKGIHEMALPCKAGRSHPVALDVDDLPAVLAQPSATAPGNVVWPAVLDGRIDRPGQVDGWRIRAKKGDDLDLELRAARLGSSLQGVLTLTDVDGKILRTIEPAGTAVDPHGTFQVPKDGDYVVRVSDRFRGRGGPGFAYRLRLGRSVPGFQLHLPGDTLTLTRGQPAKLRLAVQRQGGFNAAIALGFVGLPPGVKVTPEKINPGQAQVDLTFVAPADARIQTVRMHVEGKATMAGKEIVRRATLAGETDPCEVLVGIGLKAPFKVAGTYDLQLVARGTVFKKRYKIERNGYTGPFEVRLADRQARHLQGVTGPELKIPSGVNEFDYPVTLPPWMETGRTSRSCIMIIGKVKEGDEEHTVSYTSQAQNDQLIAVVETGRLALELGRSSVAARSGASVPVSIRRGKGLTGEVKVEVILPDHVRGVTVKPLILAASSTTGELALTFAGKAGPFNAPLVVRASLRTSEGAVTAEAKLEVVAEE